MVCKAFGLLKEKIKTFLFNIERLKKLEHARNGELRSNSYTKKAPSTKRPIASFFKSLKVYILLLGVDNIRKIMFSLQCPITMLK
jgi:hypothetical protein